MISFFLANPLAAKIGGMLVIGGLLLGTKCAYDNKLRKEGRAGLAREIEEAKKKQEEARRRNAEEFRRRQEKKYDRMRKEIRKIESEKRAGETKDEIRNRLLRKAKEGSKLWK